MTKQPVRKSGKMQWYRVDLHLHTPASADYQEPNATYLDLLKRAEMRGLDIIAFTDHNTVAGYAAMHEEIRNLEMLVSRERATPEEKRRLAEYTRLLDKILVLPGFEFTATFGFHILGIFSPKLKIRQIEHILLSLNIPGSTLDQGLTNVGATSDVLHAYRLINEAGGIVIAAHANSAHGVAMRGFDFGGQTRIAYTQDPHLHCLEVTDLDRRGRGSTARFFGGTKPEYPRRMRCIQGSDAHRLTRDRSGKNLGIGDRVTEVLLPERSFEALLEMFRSNDFARSRPFFGGADVYDYVQLAREAGPNIVQSFHESFARQGGKLYAILADVCAFANTNGGTIYIGAAGDVTVPPVGVSNIGESIEALKTEIAHSINPPLEVEIDALETSGKAVLRIQVPPGTDLPYAIDDNKIYVRDEVETSLAVRDEIVRLVLKNRSGAAAPVTVQKGKIATKTMPKVVVTAPPSLPLLPPTPSVAAPEMASSDAPVEKSAAGRRVRTRRVATSAPTGVTPIAHADLSQPIAAPAVPLAQLAGEDADLPPMVAPNTVTTKKTTYSRGGTRQAELGSHVPRTGVEIIGTETRKGEQYHIMRDLRNGSIVKNVTRSSARRLWHYAIIEHETNPVTDEQCTWANNCGLRKRYKRGGVVRYDLVLKEGSSRRIFYGVTEDGMQGEWAQFISDDEPTIVMDSEE